MSDFSTIAAHESQDVNSNTENLEDAFDEYIEQIRRDSLEWLSSSGTFKGKIQKLAKAVSTNKSMVQLTIESAKLSLKDGECLAEMLRKNNHLVVLQMNSCYLGEDQHEITLLLSNALKNNSSVNILDLSDNNLDNTDVSHISQIVKVNKTLTQLILNQNDISNNGMVELSLALMNNRSLMVLDLNRNLICDGQGIECLAKCLMVNKSLFRVDLDENNIGEISARVLARALTKNSTLGSLLLGNIGNKGVKYFAKALSVNRTLTSLYIHVSNRMIRDEINEKLDRNENEMKRLFIKTLNSDKKASWNRSRLMLVGNGKAGKSSTVNSLLGNQYNPNWDSTIGVKTLNSRILNSDGSTSWKVLNPKVVKTDYSSRFAASIMLNKHDEVNTVKGHNTSRFSKKDGSNSVTMTPDLKMGVRTPSSDNSCTTRLLDHVPKSGDDITSLRKKSLGFKSPTGRNKAIDSTTKTIVERDLKDHYLLEAKLYESSVTVNLWDFGGQEVFYSMHHLFLTKTAYYLLVFDSRDLLDDTKKTESLQYLSFWLKSIKLHAPNSKVFLAGTFCAEITALDIGLLKINKILKELTKSCHRQIAANNDENLLFFPIDNKENIGIVKLRSGISKAMESDENVCRKIPVKWVLFLDSILKHEKGQNHISLNKVKQIGNDIGITSVKEQESALEFFHERGTIIHLNYTERLKNIVIVNPQWLINSITMLIRDSDLHHFDAQRFQDVGLEDDLRNVFEHALASRDFLEYIWKNDQVEFLISLMKHTMLLSDWSFKGTESYLIPNLLADADEVPEITFDGRIRCIFDFSCSFLPIGIFQRLICLCVAYSAKCGSTSVKEPELFKNSASVECQPGLVIQLLENRQMQQISLIVDPVNAEKALSVVRSMLNKVNDEIMHNGLSWNVDLEDMETQRLITYRKASKQNLVPWFSNQKTKNDPYCDTNGNKLPDTAVDFSSFVDYF